MNLKGQENGHQPFREPCKGQERRYGQLRFQLQAAKRSRESSDERVLVQDLAGVLRQERLATGEWRRVQQADAERGSQEHIAGVQSGHQAAPLFAQPL